MEAGKTYVAVVKRVGKLDGITLSWGLGDHGLIDGERAVEVLLDGDEGEGSGEDAHVAVN